MSSEIDTSFLKISDAEMLQGVLSDCGYTGLISSGLEPGSDIAARLIVRLFRQGIKEPAQLENALHRNFGGRQVGAKLLHFSTLHRYAIQGVNPQGRLEPGIVEKGL